MSLVESARASLLRGHFGEAAALLEPLTSPRLAPETALFRASILEMVGRSKEAEEIAAPLSRSRALRDLDRSLSEFILARVAAGRGERINEFQHLQKSLALAERAAELPRVVWAQLRLLALTSNQSGLSPCSTLMASARHNVVCSGDPSLAAALHLIVADIEGKSGLLEKCQKHVRLAKSLLERSPNAWLEAWAENSLLAISLLQTDYPRAQEHGREALALATTSGVAGAIAMVLGNVGRLHFARGDLASARECLEQAAVYCSQGGEQREGIADSLARVHLALGQLDVSMDLLASIPRIGGSSETSSGYVYRHSLLTRAEVLAHSHRPLEGVATCEEALRLATESGDVILQDLARLLREQLLSVCGSKDVDTDWASSSLKSRVTPEREALYQRALACRLRASGDECHASSHYERAVRIAKSVGDTSIESETQTWWRKVEKLNVSPQPRVARRCGVFLQDAASILIHAGRPHLVATALLSTLRQLECVTAARIVYRADDGNEQTLDTFGTDTPNTSTRRFELGTARGCTVEVHVDHLPDLESHATINGVGFLIATVQELERARLQREERLTLWPADELPAEDDDSVVTGKMREVMLLARKIAPTDVTVLITGESGTGKEVLARAIHRYSARARKPFVPFNCTAVPRELLESQLFGHKRGSFTGADRDNSGLIRAAREGTLFLDEVGELGLDLQPKLLRFLERGEISPLGEPGPVSVNVRIVAATNANLERLVADGRFREDLYYRLNVFPLAIPPLRERRDEIPALARHLALKAATEFHKGRIQVGEELMAHLAVYPWPGNIRQLNNELRRMVAVADEDTTLSPEALPPGLREETEKLIRKANGLELSISLTDGLEPTVARIETAMIAVALKANNGRVDAAARALGISRKGLYLKRRRLGL